MERLNTVKLAKYLIQIAYQKQILLTITKLQKLMYALEGGLLANDIDIFNEQCVAWKYGLVYVEVFNKINPNELNCEREQDLDFTDLENHKYCEIIKRMIENVLDVFGKYNEKQLSAWASMKGSPFSKTKKNKVVSRELIRKYFNKS